MKSKAVIGVLSSNINRSLCEAGIDAQLARHSVDKAMLTFAKNFKGTIFHAPMAFILGNISGMYTVSNKVPRSRLTPINKLYFDDSPSGEWFELLYDSLCRGLTQSECDADHTESVVYSAMAKLIEEFMGDMIRFRCDMQPVIEHIAMLIDWWQSPASGVDKQHGNPNGYIAEFANAINQVRFKRNTLRQATE